MKTLKFQLLAMMVIIATVNIATIAPATAQRRSTQHSKTEKEAEKTTNSRAQTVQEKSTFKNYDTKPQAPRRSTVRGNRNVQRANPGSAVRENTSQPKSEQRPVTTRSSRQNTERKAAVTQQPQRSPETTRRNVTNNKRGSSNNEPIIRERNQNNERNTRTYSGTTNRNNDRYNSSVRSSTNTRANRSERNAVKTRDNAGRVNNSNFYRHDTNDRRYTPNREYHGNNKYWTRNYRAKNMNYNHSNRNFYRKYNYRDYNHWDRRWENYRWNVSSWRDYYGGYNPYSYRFNRYYYHHPVYGEVISRFVYQPYVFIHNHHRYYSYDGHFFRYVGGIGYVLVNLPFGVLFQELPMGYDRVFINGYLYFRIGNLFFENTDYGFSLVHYPERYYSYNNDYVTRGYFFDDDVY